ncbi:MAG: ABC transporter permease, partial [Lewinella sp.]|nr:ABC transporter permease [Lewinella sp.]
MSTFLTFLADNQSKLLELTLEHIALTLASLVLACALAIPLGLWIARRQWAAGPALGFAGVLQTIPSIALLGFMIPVLGIGVKPAIFALFLYAILPVLRNTFTGVRGVPPAVR